MLLAAAVALATVGWPGGARTALAHEFSLALVTPTSATGSPGLESRDVIDGFRLAVDRSPDVSHAPGPEAGDHLGGVDVDVSVVDGTSPTAAAAAVKQRVGAGLTAVVVIATDETARAVAKELQGSSVLLVVARGAGASFPDDVGTLQLEQVSAPTFDGAAAAEVATAYEREHGRGLSPAAALGYDAGRLLDVAVARAADGIEDLASVVAAGAEVDDELVSANVSTPRGAAAGAPSGTRSEPTADAPGRGSPGALLVLLGAALLAGLGGWAVRLRRRRAG